MCKLFFTEKLQKSSREVANREGQAAIIAPQRPKTMSICPVALPILAWLLAARQPPVETNPALKKACHRPPASHGVLNGGPGDKRCSQEDSKWFAGGPGRQLQREPDRDPACRHGSESSEWNTRAFSIPVGTEGKEFTTVVSVIGSNKDVSTHALPGDRPLCAVGSDRGCWMATRRRGSMKWKCTENEGKGRFLQEAARH